MGLVIYAYHFAAVGFCSSLKERLASLSGKTCCSICSESNSCFFPSHEQPQEKDVVHKSPERKGQEVIEVMFLTVIFCRLTLLA